MKKKTKKIIGVLMIVFPLIAMAVIGLVFIETWGGILLILPGITLFCAYIWVLLDLLMG